jgi:short-subunit dehydrogenase
MDFRDKVVWITGASSGIGAALARESAKRGARVVLSARNAGALEQVAAECGDRARTLVLPMDVTQFDAAGPLADKVVAAFGRIDVLILNAGISQRGRAIDTSLAVDQAIFNTNFFGPVALTKAVLPIMLRQKEGRIVVVSSLVGKFGTPLRSSYAASKHALQGFYDSLRAELWRDNIGVTIVLPGFVRTEVSKNALKGDGTRHGEMDASTGAGMSPATCASRALDAVAAGREEVLIGGSELRGVYLKRFAPGLFSRFIRKAKVT